jgi:hypothetical protein
MLKINKAFKKANRRLLIDKILMCPHKNRKTKKDSQANLEVLLLTNKMRSHKYTWIVINFKIQKFKKIQLIETLSKNLLKQAHCNFISNKKTISKNFQNYIMKEFTKRKEPEMDMNHRLLWILKSRTTN